MEDFEKLKKTYNEFVSTMKEKDDLKPVQKIVVELKLVQNLKQKAFESANLEEYDNFSTKEKELLEMLSRLGVKIN